VRRRVLAVLLLVCCALALVRCARPSAPVVAPDGGEPTIRIATYNVNFGVAATAEVVAAIERTDADIVLLQETTDEAEALLLRELGDDYPHALFRECCRAGGLGILSRHPIVEDEYLPSQRGWFPAWRVVVATPIGTVQLVDVHLRPPISDSGSWVAGYFSTGGFRKQELEDVWPTLADIPTIVAGDFNESEGGDALTLLRERGFESALPQHHPAAHTWRWRTRLGMLRLRLDHLVYGPGLTATWAEVIDVGPSDHLPVVAVFRAEPDLTTHTPARDRGRSSRSDRS
jgi:endonuclease/exonuclease/phosphatase (EEP) superfamily protein YafD